MNIWITAFPTVVIFLLFSIFLNFKLKSQKKSITILLLLFVLLFIDQLKDEYQHLNFYFKSFIFVAMLLVLLSNKKLIYINNKTIIQNIK